VNPLQRIWRRLGELAPVPVLLLGFALFLIYAFPGYMSTDSVAQLTEARAFRFSDAHPPLMAAEWGVLDRIVSGPILMLFVQGSVFLAGLYHLLKHMLSPVRAAWLACAVLLFPPVLTPMAVIWKDSQMVSFLVAGAAALLHPRLRVRIGGLALIAFACSLRHNALAAAAPLVFFLFEWRPGGSWLKRIGILIGATVLTLGATFAATKVLTAQHVRLTPVFQDVVGMVAFTDQRTDDEMRELLRGTPLLVNEAIQTHAVMLYEMRGAWRITQGADPMFSYPTNEAEWAALSRVWKELAFSDPYAYFASHCDTYGRLIGFSEPSRAPVWNLFLEDGEAMWRVEHHASWSRAQQWLGRAFVALAIHTPLFTPYVYAVVALVLLVLVCRDRLSLALLTSGLLYQLSFFPFGADPDYRYSHWMITSVLLACIVMFKRRWSAAP
jgi:hypothetical protein